MNTYEIRGKTIKALTATAALQQMFPNARNIKWAHAASDHSYNEFVVDGNFPIVVYNIEIAPAKYIP